MYLKKHYYDKPEYKEMTFHFDSILFNMDKINHGGVISTLCQIVRTLTKRVSITWHSKVVVPPLHRVSNMMQASTHF